MKRIKLLFLFTLLNALLPTTQAQQTSNFEIIDFSPLRVVVKLHKDIPIRAIVENKNQFALSLTARLVLPQSPFVQLVEGPLEREIAIPEQTRDTLLWTVRFDSIAAFPLKLKITKPEYAEKAISLNVVNEYWHENEFFLSAYNPPYAQLDAGPPFEDEVFEYYQNANFDNMMWVRDDDQLMAKVQQFGFTYLLDIANFYGEEGEDRYLKGGPNTPVEEITEEMLLELDAFVNKYKNDPKLVGYYICNEPYETAFPNIAKVIARIRQNDPTRPCLVEIWPYFEPDEYRDYPIGDDPYVDKFLQITKADILCYDRYIFYLDGYDEQDDYFKQILRMRSFSLSYDIPFYTELQAVGTNGTSAAFLEWRVPDESEMRWLIYSSLAYGVHGIIWFHWYHEWGVTGNPCGPQVYPQIQTLNAEIDSLKDIMEHLTTTAVYHSDDMRYNTAEKPNIIIQPDQFASLIVGTFKDDNEEEKYYMVMNKDYDDELETQVFINYTLNELQTFDVETNTWEDVSFENNEYGATYNLYLEPGAGKLFRLEGQQKEIGPEQELLLLFPNPTTDQLTIISLYRPLEYIEIYDASGKRLRQMPAQGDRQTGIAVEDFPSGLYFVKITYDDGEIGVQKFVKN